MANLRRRSPRRHAPFWLDRRTRPVLLCLLTRLLWHISLGHILLRTVVRIRPQIVVGHCISPPVRTRLIIIGQRPTAVSVVERQCWWSTHEPCQLARVVDDLQRSIGQPVRRP